MPLFAGSNLVKVNSSKNKFKANFYIKPSTLAAKDNWYKGTTAKNTITEINIVDSYTPTGNETESWNADVDNNGSIKCYINGTVLTMAGNGAGKIMCNGDSSRCFYNFTGVLNINGLSLFNTSKVYNMVNMFYHCISLTTLDLSNWNTSKVVNMSCMFINCYDLTSLDVSNFNTSKVTDMSSMFMSCYNLTSLNISNFDTSKVTDMSGMFSCCYRLINLNLNNFDTSNVTDMSSMFHYYCINLKDKTLNLTGLNTWDTSKVTNMSRMFSYAFYMSDISIATLDLSGWDTSNVTNMSGMFNNFHYGIYNISLDFLGLDKWNTSNVTNMSEMFYNTGAAYNAFEKILKDWNTAKVTDMSGMFFFVVNSSNSSLLGIINLTGWDTSKVTDMSEMFSRCYSLREIQVSSLWSTEACTKSNNMFLGCTNLVGDIPFDSNYTDKTYATTTSGYLTYKAASNT